ncbi:MAG: hypothetical protein WEA56_10090 [Balneolaceae bacterium]
MKTIIVTPLITCIIIAVMALQGVAQDMQQQQASEIIDDWPEVAKEAAQNTIDEYGEPDEQNPEMLIWFDNGDWSKTVIQREEIDHEFPMPHKDVLLQEINYEVPPEKFTELAKYDGSIIIECTKGTIAARCDKEGANYLAINLAHDIIEGKKSVEEARNFYAETIKHMMEGESSEYLNGFIFDKPQGETGDPDEAVFDMDEMDHGEMK